MKSWLNVVVGVVLLAGCGSDATKPEPEPAAGTLSFTYRGVATGSFTSNGELSAPPDSVIRPVTGATAFRQDGQIALLGTRAVSGTKVEAFMLLLGELSATGKYSM